MTTYAVLVSDELLPDFTNENPAIPDGFRVLDVSTEPDARQRATWVWVSDDNAPAWTEGERIDVSFTSHYNADGTVARTTVSEYRQVFT